MQTEEPDEVQEDFDEEGERGELLRSLDEDVELCSEWCPRDAILAVETDDLYDVSETGCWPREKTAFAGKLKFRPWPNEIKEGRPLYEIAQLVGIWLVPDILDRNDGPIESRLNRDLFETEALLFPHC